MRPAGRRWACHFQKPTALADPRIRLDRARMQSGFDPAPVRKWAALSSFWIRTRLHQGSERPKPVTDPASCGTSCGSGESGDSVPGTVTRAGAGPFAGHRKHDAISDNNGDAPSGVRPCHTTERLRDNRGGYERTHRISPCFQGRRLPDPRPATRHARRGRCEPRAPGRGSRLRAKDGPPRLGRLPRRAPISITSNHSGSASRLPMIPSAFHF
jgi:hypothetical protein